MNFVRLVISLIIGFSAIVVLFLFWLIYFAPQPDGAGFDFSFLAGLNAFLNGCATVCLCFGYRHIRKKNIDRHKKWMLAAFVCSSLFLISYLIYHTYQGDTKFLGTGAIRYAYFTILISHIILSVVALPLILTSFFFSLTNRITFHRIVSKFTLPIWLYVSVTGVLVYLMIKIIN